MSKIGHTINKKIDRLVQSTQEKVGSAEKTEYDSEFIRLENQVKILKEDYKLVIKMAKQYLQPHPGLRIEEVIYEKLDLDKKNKVSKTPIGAFGDIMIVTGDKIGEENILGAAFYKTGRVERQIGEYWLTFENEVDTKFIDPLQTFIDKEIKEAANLREKLEKARLDMDSTKAKVRRASRTLNFTPETDYKIKKQTAKLQEAEVKYKNLLHNSSTKFKYIAEDSQMVDLLTFIKSQLDYFRKGFTALEDLYGNLSSLRNNDRRKQLIDGEAGLQALALYDYSASSDDELSLLEGESLFYFVDTGNEGWWEALKNGRSGLVPANYVEFEKAIAKCDYAGNASDDLSFKEGSEITILHKDVGEEGIFYGFFDGNTGFFPSKCVSKREKDVKKEKSMDSLHMSQLFKSTSNLSISEMSRKSSFVDFPQDDEIKEQILSVVEELNYALQQCSSGSDLNQISKFKSTEQDLLLAAENLSKSSKKFVDLATTSNPNADSMSSLFLKDVQNLKQVAVNYASTLPVESQIKIISIAMSVVMSASKIVSGGKGLKEACKLMVSTISNLIDAIVTIPKAEEEPKDQSTIGNAIEKIGLLANKLVEVAKEREPEIAKPSTNLYKKDSIWSEGIISAAEAVSDSVANLILKYEALNPEEIKSISMLIQSTTASLISASKVGKPSRLHDLLQFNGQELTKAVEDLINLLKQPQLTKEAVDLQNGYAKKKAQQLESQSRLLNLEREMEKEREKLLDLRKREYNGAI